MADITHDSVNDTVNGSDFIQSQKGVSKIVVTPENASNSNNSDGVFDCLGDDILANVNPTKNMIYLMIGISE